MDTNGLLLGVYVHPADISDRDSAKVLLRPVSERIPGLSLIWADQGYTGQDFKDWVRDHLHAYLDVVRHPIHLHLPEGEKPPPTPRGFRVLPRRWVVERTFAWQGRNRRLAKDYEGLPASEETFIYLSMVHLMARRLTS